MSILVLNCGSSSVKFELICYDTEETLARGLVDRIGPCESTIKVKSRADKYAESIEAPDHLTAIKGIFKLIKNLNVIKSYSCIRGIGHRVVHGGEEYHESVLIDEDVIKTIRSLFNLAPLHNPPNLEGILACKEILGSDVPQVAVFDTAFHQTMPPEAYVYPIPYEYYEQMQIRRYGFHGTSHYYVSRRAIELLGRKAEDSRIITAHLGNGCSITAIKNGKVIDTSMGMTPLEGLVMGTRCGNIDTAIVFHLLRNTDKDSNDLDTILNKKSGLLGISGVSNDMKVLRAAAEKGSERAQLAIKIFVQYLKRYIGAYTAELGGCDALVFTGGIGENAEYIREMACEGLFSLGLDLDREKNLAGDGEREISKAGSRGKIFVIPTNEEIVIARDTKKIIGALTAGKS